MTVQLLQAITSNKHPLNLGKSVGCSQEVHEMSICSINNFGSERNIHKPGKNYCYNRQLT